MLIFMSSEMMAQGFDLVQRTTPASCHEICDGSVQLGLDRSDERVKYYWKAEKDNQYRPLSSNYLLGMCPGQYRIRKMMANEDALSAMGGQALLLDYEPLAYYKVSTRGLREVTIVLDFDRLVNHMNYYVKSQFSLNGGETWVSSSQLHQALDSEGSQARFTFDLPRSFENQQDVLVQFYKRNSEEEGSLDISIVNGLLRSKTYEEYNFEIQEKVSLNVESTVSNETDGADGYIGLRVSEGTPPYRYQRSNEASSSRIENLVAGRYGVKVIDSKGCSVSAEYLIEPPEGLMRHPDFQLTQTSIPEVFNLKVSNLYRERIHLSIIDTSGTEYKEFRINPLYDDLEIKVELGKLPKGWYQAIFSTDSFSKNIDLMVK